MFLVQNKKKKINYLKVHLSSDFEPKAILHSYKKSFNGFVIKLTQEEAGRMAGTIVFLLISNIT